MKKPVTTFSIILLLAYAAFCVITFYLLNATWTEAGYAIFFFCLLFFLLFGEVKSEYE